MYNNYKDPHTDYTNNWIEKAIYEAWSYLDANYTDEETAAELISKGIKEETLSLILAAAKILLKDDQEDYLGD